MNRQLTIWFGAALVFVCALFYDFVQNPVAKRGDRLLQRLNDARETAVDIDRTVVDFANRQKMIVAKPNLWRELVSAAAPVAAPPDLKKMLEGVKATRQQVGDRVKLISKANKQSQYVAQGDEFDGLTVKLITAKEVLFSLIRASQEYTIALPRE